MNSVNRAILLAAGKGTRLYPLTEFTHKSLIPIAGVRLFDNAVEQLKACGVNDIIVVTGDKSDQLEAHARMAHADKAIRFVRSDRYASTNNLVSLWAAREFFDEDFLLLETDVFFEQEILQEMCGPGEDNLAAVARDTVQCDGGVVAVSGGKVVAFYPDRSAAPIGIPIYKTVNLYRVSTAYASGPLSEGLASAISRGEDHRYYESVFRDDVASGRVTFHSIDCSNSKWFEIDNLNDLDLADYRFAPTEKRQEIARSRHGGYWRYDFVDHSLLYNLHYPPPRLVAHLTGRANELIRHYPAGQGAVCEYLGRALGINAEHLVVGNGSAEFIRALRHVASGPLVVPVPSFNEYTNAAAPGAVHPFPLPTDDGFRLDVAAFADFTRDRNARIAVIINPNNPTGGLTDCDELIHYLEAVRGLGTLVVVDESFIEFAPGGSANSLLPVLARFPGLVVLKSLSKTHGIGGLRLGFVATANPELVRRFRACTPIWNVNGFAEEYLRVFAAYTGEFRDSCLRVRADTEALRLGLSSIPGVEAYPTAANYVFCRLASDEWTADRLAAELFAHHDILIKDCSGKDLRDAQRYFRVAARLPAENERLLAALSEVLRVAPMVRPEIADEVSV